MSEPFDTMRPADRLVPSLAGQGHLERMDPRVKICAILCASVLAVTLDRVASLAIFALACGLPVLMVAQSRSQLRPLVLVLGLATWGTILSQALFYDRMPRTILLTLVPAFEAGGLELSGLNLYREGMLHGLVQSLRFDALILLGTSVCLTTSPDRLFLGLTRLRVPYGLSFMAVTAVRFLPIMLEELRTVLAVRKLRGYRPLRRGIRETIRVEASTLKPVVVKALRRSTDLATSLSLRAFDPAAERSSYRSLKMSLPEKAGLLGMVAITACLVLLKVSFLLYLHEVLYVPEMRGLYAWVRAYL